MPLPIVIVIIRITSLPIAQGRHVEVKFATVLLLAPWAWGLKQLGSVPLAQNLCKSNAPCYFAPPMYVDPPTELTPAWEQCKKAPCSIHGGPAGSTGSPSACCSAGNAGRYSRGRAPKNHSTAPVPRLPHPSLWSGRHSHERQMLQRSVHTTPGRWLTKMPTRAV